ncbi:Phosphate-selective porin O and P [Pirellulimonas nuda]|uniref:Phosphate-selective porin O and P n=1 Tax=Pirellulimonas nuda TaxID=2528009 RepID=A0A518DGQ4_9BACT|nr:porin [Pirellulimonas nuda]QDU90655.1 Phosphate-selective porin O and P [Pirellulimonas nuda]
MHRTFFYGLVAAWLAVAPARAELGAVGFQTAYWMDEASPPTAGSEEKEDESDEQESFADRLEAMESKYADLDEAFDELSDANKSLKDSLKDYARTGNSGTTMRISGRIHFDVWTFPGDSPGVNGFESGDNDVSPQDRIGFRRMRLGAAGDMWLNTLYKIELEFAGGDDIEYRDVYLGVKELPVLQTVLIGNQKRPYGLDHLNSSRYNVFLERPYVIEGFNQDARRLGIQSYGFSDDLAYNWRYGAFNQRLTQDEGKYASDHWQSQFAARFANTIWYDETSGGRGYAHWGVSGTFADTDGDALTDNFSGSGKNEAQFRSRPEARSETRWLDTGIIPDTRDYGLLGWEAVLNVGAVQMVGEWQNVWLNRDGENLQYQGGYAYVSYFLTGEYMPWDRETGTLDRVVPYENFFIVDDCEGCRRCGLGAWQVAARYSYADFSDGDLPGAVGQGGVGSAMTLALNWYWNPYAKVQLNYLYGQITDNQLNAVGSFADGDYHILGMRFAVDY